MDTEAIRRYGILVGRYFDLQEKHYFKENLSERTIARYRSIQNNVSTKIMIPGDLYHLVSSNSDLKGSLLKIMGEEAKSDGDVRSIRSALRYAISIEFWGIVNKILGWCILNEDMECKEIVGIELDKLDILLNFIDVLYLLKFAVRDKKANTNAHQFLEAIDRERIYKHLIENNRKYYAAASVLFLTGCSPCDVLKGVSVEAQAESIGFKLQYSKNSSEMVRGISIDKDDPFYELAKKLRAGHSRIDLGGKELWRTSELARAVSNIGKEVGLLKAVSPTSFRQAFACDLGRMGFSRKIIARALGYQNEAARILFVRAKMGLPGRKVQVDWSKPDRNEVVHPAPAPNGDELID